MATAEVLHGETGRVNLPYALDGSGHVYKDKRHLKDSTHQRSQEMGMASVSAFVAAVVM